jgi:hypothetical protein
MVGGMCSLLGTSVNLVAASLLENYDAKQKIGLFEFFGVGAVICVFTIFYIAVAAWHLLPREVRKSNDESENLTVDEHRQYLASFILSKESVYNGHTVKDSGITTAKDVEFVGIVSQGKSLPFDLSHTLQAGDEYVPSNVLQVQVWLLVTLHVKLSSSYFHCRVR